MRSKRFKLAEKDVGNNSQHELHCIFVNIFWKTTTVLLFENQWVCRTTKLENSCCEEAIKFRLDNIYVDILGFYIFQVLFFY